MEGYWGAVTSSIDWCEKNYAVSRYVAEFWNTVSCLPYLVVGFGAAYHAYHYKLPSRFIFANLLLVVVGLGSIAFHGTLQHHSQMWDEVPMVLFELLHSTNTCD